MKTIKPLGLGEVDRFTVLVQVEESFRDLPMEERTRERYINICEYYYNKINDVIDV